jgi:molybdopterin molybdotransferase
MISVSEAIRLLREKCAPLSPLNTPLLQSTGLVLAEDVVAATNVPGFQQSAMDGFAFRFEDYQQSNSLTIAGEIAAGDQAIYIYQPQAAIRIFTGAPLPSWADTVVMQEKTDFQNKTLYIIDEQLVKGSNVRMEGSEIRKGELALSKGTVLTPAAIGFLASVGINEVKTIPKPIVHIIVTGNELQEPGHTLLSGQVYESNSILLQSALQQLHIIDVSVTKVKDDPDAVKNIISSALEKADLILITGGVSVGKYDFVVQAAEACDVQQLFHKVAQRPGKPLYAGINKKKLIFGLPGNPASVLTCFYVYVVAAIEAMMGKKLSQTKELLLTESFSKKVKFTQFLKAIYTGNEVKILPAQESFRLSSFALANCLVVLPQEKMEFAKGEMVETILLP